MLQFRSLLCCHLGWNTYEFFWSLDFSSYSMMCFITVFFAFFLFESLLNQWLDNILKLWSFLGLCHFKYYFCPTFSFEFLCILLYVCGILLHCKNLFCIFLFFPQCFRLSVFTESIFRLTDWFSIIFFHLSNCHLVLFFHWLFLWWNSSFVIYIFEHFSQSYVNICVWYFKYLRFTCGSFSVDISFSLLS